MARLVFSETTTTEGAHPERMGPPCFAHAREIKAWDPPLAANPPYCDTFGSPTTFQNDFLGRRYDARMRQYRFGPRIRAFLELMGLLLLVVNPCSTTAIAADLEAQSFKVLVLDAVSGKPQENMQVHFYCQDSRRNYSVEEDDTDSEGVVIIPYRCKGEDPEIAIFVTGLPREQCGGDGADTYERISSKGIISAPDAAGEMHCTTRVSRKLKPVPGQVIIFVKKPSWWQSHF